MWTYVAARARRPPYRGCRPRRAAPPAAAAWRLPVDGPRGRALRGRPGPVRGRAAAWGGPGRGAGRARGRAVHGAGGLRGRTAPRARRRRVAALRAADGDGAAGWRGCGVGAVRGRSWRAAATVGARAVGRVRLGARVTVQRLGYRDPLTLVGAGGRGRGAAGRAAAGSRAARRRRPLRRQPRAAPGGRSAARPRAPSLAWIGLALVACALPGGAIAWRARPPARPARAVASRRADGRRIEGGRGGRGRGACPAASLVRLDPRRGHNVTPRPTPRCAARRGGRTRPE